MRPGRSMLMMVFLVLSAFFIPNVFASTPAVKVISTEEIFQRISYDQTVGDGADIVEAPGTDGENRTGISRTGIELQNTTIVGYLNISNVETVGNHTLSSVNITINETENVESWEVFEKPGYLVFNSSVDLDDPQQASETTFFIPELRANDSLILSFNTTEGTYTEPLNFTEVYSDWRVMTGRSVNVSLNVTNNFQDNVEIYDLQVFKTPHLYNSTNENVNHTFFTYDDMRGTDAPNADIFTDSLSRTIINWTPSGGSLDQGEVASIIFNSTAPVNVSLNYSSSSQWAIWMNMGNITATFAANGSLSGINIKNITAKPTAAMMSTSKERINESFFWNTTANISNMADSPLDYEVEQITLWATKQGEFSDPGDQNSFVEDTTLFASDYETQSGTLASASWNTSINLSAGMTLDNFSMAFNYSYVPIAWVTTDFSIFDDGYQLTSLNETVATGDDQYLFIEEIYVLLGGYLVKATKSLTPLETANAANVYQVNITIENIGDERTPELVTMFDLLPKDFNPMHYSAENVQSSREMTSSESILRVSDRSGDIDKRVTGSDMSDFVLGSSDSGNIASGPYEGYWGYYIDFNYLEPQSDGDGLYDVDSSESEILIRYKMQGNHSLVQVENAHIVGIDPVRLEGANPSQSVASRLSVASQSSERVILFSSLALSISILLIAFIVSKKYSEVEK